MIEKQFLPDLEFVEQQAIGWSYVEGICKRMKVPSKLEDCSTAMLQKVLLALDTHIRRLAQRKGIPIKDLPSGYFRKGVKAKQAQAQYRHDNHHHKTQHGEAA